MFAQTLSEVGNPFSPSQGVASASSGAFSNLLGSASALGGNFLDKAAQEYAIQDRRDHQRAVTLDNRAHQRAVTLDNRAYQESQRDEKRAFEAERKAIDNQFMAGVYAEVGRVREATRQGVHNQLQEATKINRIMQKAFQSRADLASEIRGIDNDLIGADAAVVESEQFFFNENLAQDILETELKASPHLTQFKPDGSIDLERSFTNAMNVRANKERLSAAIQRQQLNNAALTGANLSLEATQKKTELLEKEALREFRSITNDLVNDNLSALLQHGVNAMERGEYDEVEVAKMLSTAKMQMEQFSRSTLIDMGITDDNVINANIAQLTAGYDQMIRHRKVEADTLKLLSDITTGEDKINIRESLGPIVTLDSMVQGATRDIWSNLLVRNKDAFNEMAFDIGPAFVSSMKTLISGVSTPDANLTTDQAADMTPAVEGMIKKRKVKPEEIPQTINATANWLKGLAEAASQDYAGNADAINKVLGDPTVRSNLRVMKQSEPEQFEEYIAPKLDRIVDLTISDASKDLSENLIADGNTNVLLVQRQDRTVAPAIRNSYIELLMDKKDANVGLQQELIDSLPEGDPLIPLLEEEINAYQETLDSRTNAKEEGGALNIENVTPFLSKFNNAVKFVKKIIPLTVEDEGAAAAIIDRYTPRSVRQPFAGVVSGRSAPGSTRGRPKPTEDTETVREEPDPVSTFTESLDHVFKSEGGFSNHPDDPGGATNKGITLATLKSYREDDTLTSEDVANITTEEASQIYKKEYWDKVNADKLPKGLALVVFDTAVNNGPGKAAKLLQKVVGAKVDGRIGPETLAKVAEMDETEVINTFLADRLEFMMNQLTWDVFGKGWTKRLLSVQAEALNKTS